MFLMGKIGHPVEIKIPDEKYYKFFKNYVYHIPNITPTIQDVAVHEGDWDTSAQDSIKVWNYTIDGKPEVIKERPEFDDEKLTVTLTALGGDLLKQYKSFKITHHAAPKGPEHCLVYLTMEYEKYDPTTPDPDKYLHLVSDIIKDMEAYLK